MTPAEMGSRAVAAPRAAVAGPLGVPIGLELWPLGDALTKDFEGTLSKVAAMGYGVVELPSFYGRTPAQMRGALKGAGLGCISAGVLPNPLAPGMPSLETDADAVFGPLAELGVTYAVCLLPPIPIAMRTPEALKRADPFEAMFDQFTDDTWRQAADFLNVAGAKAKAHGLRLAYHNHDMEFRSQYGRPGYDLLLEVTDPALVDFEMDCCFVAAEGYDPARYLREHGARIRLLHIKDIARRAGRRQDLQMTAVGQGFINWRPVFEAAKAARIQQYFVELDPPLSQPVFDLLQQSFDYLRALKV